VSDIQQLFEVFILENEFSRKLRPETIRGYREVFSLFVKLLPDVQLNELNAVAIVSFFKVLQERKRLVGKGLVKVGIKKSTVVTYRNKLNAFFNWLERNGHISKNPFKDLKYPSVSYNDKQFLKREQIEKIFTAIYLHHNSNLLILKRNIALFNILLFCGLRREEILLLQVRDIDIDRKTLTIRADTSKSGITRYVPLSSTVIVAIKDYLLQRQQYSSASFLVSSNADRSFSYDGLKHLVVKLNKLSGVRFHLHQFRHTFAINFLKQTNNLFKLKELLGHKDIRMTAVYLRHLPLDEMRDDIEKMNIDRLI
jgi:integrase